MLVRTNTAQCVSRRRGTTKESRAYVITVQNAEAIGTRLALSRRAIPQYPRVYTRERNNKHDRPTHSRAELRSRVCRDRVPATSRTRAAITSIFYRDSVMSLLLIKIEINLLKIETNRAAGYRSRGQPRRSCDISMMLSAIFQTRICQSI